MGGTYKRRDQVFYLNNHGRLEVWASMNGATRSLPSLQVVGGVLVGDTTRSSPSDRGRLRLEMGLLMGGFT